MPSTNPFIEIHIQHAEFVADQLCELRQRVEDIREFCERGESEADGAVGNPYTAILLAIAGDSSLLTPIPRRVWSEDEYMDAFAVWDGE